MRRRSLAVVPLALCVVSCVPNKMYRPNPDDREPGTSYFVREQLTVDQFEPIDRRSEADKENPIQWPYRLAFIEFDDRGEMFKREQLRRTISEIAQAKRDAQAIGQPVVVAVFVHGWKNNASEKSGNVWGFRQVLAGLSKQYAVLRSEQKLPPLMVPVVGVYIGWRGAVLSPPVLKELTIYDRQRKSQNLPGAHLVEALLEIMQATKGINYDVPESSAISILIGHSFGGAVLETALSQTLVGLAVEAKATGKMRWPATLIAFVNEAQEATRSFQLIDAFRMNLPARDAPVTSASPSTSTTPTPSLGTVDAKAAPTCVPPTTTVPPDPPGIVSISSTGDVATRVAHVGAQTLRRPFNSLRSYDTKDPNFLGLKNQTSMFVNTTAHMKAFQTHLLSPCRCVGPTDSDGLCISVSDLRCENQELQQALGKCAINTQSRLGGTEYVLIERPDAKNRTPYWAFQMPPTIVPDHSTIFTPVFRNFLLTLIRTTVLTRQMRADAASKPSKDAKEKPKE